MSKLIELAEEKLSWCIDNIDKFRVKEYFKHTIKKPCCEEGFIGDLGDSYEDVTLSINDMQKAISPESLQYSKDNHELMNRGYGGMISMKAGQDLVEYEDAVSEITGELSSLLGGEWLASGFHYYPKYAYMGWHHNANHPGRRVYLTFAESDKKSYFKYEQDGEIKTKYDPKGWSINEFDVTDDEYFWHAIGSEDKRYSFGFRELLTPRQSLSNEIS